MWEGVRAVLQVSKRVKSPHPLHFKPLCLLMLRIILFIVVVMYRLKKHLFNYIYLFYNVEINELPPTSSLSFHLYCYTLKNFTPSNKTQRLRLLAFMLLFFYSFIYLLLACLPCFYLFGAGYFIIFILFIFH